MREKQGPPDVPYFIFEDQMTRMERTCRAWAAADVIAFLLLIGSNVFWVIHFFF